MLNPPLFLIFGDLIPIKMKGPTVIYLQIYMDFKTLSNTLLNF